MPNCAPLVAAVVTLPASVSAKATMSPGPATARYLTHHGRFAAGASSGGSGGRVVRVAMIAYLFVRDAGCAGLGTPNLIR
jgi:hypothetical protein